MPHAMVSNPATAAATIEQAHSGQTRPLEITLSHSASTVVLTCEDLIIVRTVEEGTQTQVNKPLDTRALQVPRAR